MKKMMLVPQQGLPSPLLQKLGRLDQEMKHILESTDLDEQTKANQYSQVLGRYLDTKAQYEKPLPIPIVEQTATKPGKVVNLDSIPSVYRKKASSIVQHITDDPEIDWNERNELIVDGQTIKNSNIIDLVDDLARPSTKREPRGVEEFTQALRRSNIPDSFIANSRRREPTRRPVARGRHQPLPDPPTPPNTPKRSGGRWKKW